MIETTDVMTDRPKSASPDPPDYDPVSLVLDGIRLSGATCFSLSYRGSWACKTPTPHEHPPTHQFERQQAVLFHIIAQGAGTCFAFDREMPIAAGDLIIFPFGDEHVLAGGEPVEPVHVMAALPDFPWPPTPRFTLGNGAETLGLICGVLYFEGLGFNPLFGSLPRVIHIPSARQNRSDWLSSSIDLIVREFDQPVPGGINMSKRLAEVLFVALLRRLLLKLPITSPDGWRRLLIAEWDAHWPISIPTWPHHGPSRGLHAPAAPRDRAWRRSFASWPAWGRWNTSCAGVSKPTRRSLQSGNATVAQAAYEAGYNSEPAFSRAFKRVFGVAPGSLRKAPFKSAADRSKGQALTLSRRRDPDPALSLPPIQRQPGGPPSCRYGEAANLAKPPPEHRNEDTCERIDRGRGDRKYLCLAPGEQCRHRRTYRGA